MPQNSFKSMAPMVTRSQRSIRSRASSALVEGFGPGRYHVDEISGDDFLVATRRDGGVLGSNGRTDQLWSSPIRGLEDDSPRSLRRDRRSRYPTLPSALDSAFAVVLSANHLEASPRAA